jgi:hypothetical protein
LLAGPGVILAYIAYLNRGGPGEVCTVDGREHDMHRARQSRGHFLVVAVALVLGLPHPVPLAQRRAEVAP